MNHKTLLLFAFIFLCISKAFPAGGAPGVNFTPGPQPGDAYWEYIHVPKIPGKTTDWYICVDYPWAKKFTIKFPDLTHATRADVAIEYWGGHVGTSVQRLVVNGNTSKPVYYPLPKNTPGRPNCYLRNMNGNSSSNIPLSLLKNGSNTFEFFHGPQICHSFGWPQTWAYAAILRVYFDPSKVKRPEGQITKPAPGATIGENPHVAATATYAGGVARVDFIGHYEDFDWEGNGLFTQWHYQTQKGRMKYHVGYKTSAPYQATWYTKKIPDQPNPVKFAAIIRGKDGYNYVTKAVSGIRLARKTSVKLAKPSLVPENFAVRVGKSMNCKINLPKNYKQATSATLIVPTWSAAHAGEPGPIVKINGIKIKQGFGAHHYYSYDQFVVPLSALTKGSALANFSVWSDTHHHATEILWPGPAILLNFPTADNSVPFVTVSSAKASPAAISNDKDTEVAFSANVVSSKGATIKTVTIDLSSLKGSATQAMVKGSGNAWTCKFKVPKGISPKEYPLALSARDAGGVAGAGSVLLTVQKGETGVFGNLPGSIAGTGSTVRVLPRAGAVIIHLRNAASADTRIRILDCQGRLVRAIPISPGQGFATWQGRNVRGGMARAGLYVLCVKSDTGKTLHRFIYLGK